MSNEPPLPPQLLVIDDSETFQDALADYLSRWIPSIRATTLRQAERLYYKNKASIKFICLDGCVNGQGKTFDSAPLARKIRKDGFSGPLIAISSDQEINAELMKAGCSHQVRKWQAPEYL